MCIEMDGESTNNSEELIQILGNRIEEIEHILHDDEDFCNKDIDSTYNTALKFLKNIQEKVSEKLNELKVKLDKIREENLRISKQNKKQFDDDIELINQLFTEGKHQEGLEKFHEYEKCFEQRKTIIQNIPKIYMNDIDINQYFSIDKPIVSPVSPVKQTKIESPKKEANNEINEQESDGPHHDIRMKHPDNQPTLINNQPMNRERTFSVSLASPRSLRISTRLPPSPSSRSLPTTEHDINMPILVPNNHRNSRENIPNHNTQVRSTPASPNIVPPIIHRQLSNVKPNRTDLLTPTYVTHYQHEKDVSALMICNEDRIIIFRNQSTRSPPSFSITINRSDVTEQEKKSHNFLIKSTGFIDSQKLYIFTEHEFLIYSSNLSTKFYSQILLTDNNHISDYDHLSHSFIGTTDDKYIYYIYLNIQGHWILSILDLQTINHICDHNLSEIFPDIKRYIYLCTNEKNLNFLVEMDGSHYAVLFCTNTIYSKIELKRKIQLYYAEKPLTICPIYVDSIQKYIYFINDPSTKIIHIITSEKYLKSYTLVAFSLCYFEKSHELFYTSTDGLYSININEQQNFFSKSH